MVSGENQILGRIPRNSEEEVRVQLTNYRGQSGLDFRIFYRQDSLADEFYPTKRGFRIGVDDLNTLRDILKKADRLIKSAGG